MPNTSDEMLRQLNIANADKMWEAVYSNTEIAPNTKVIEKGEPLFVRLEEAEEIEYIKSNMK